VPTNNNGSGCLCGSLQVALAQQIVGVGLAAAALRGHAQFALQIAHAAGPLFHAFADFVVSDAIANTDIHAYALSNDNDYQYFGWNLQVSMTFILKNIRTI
jgi:hypothetical protein